MLNIKTILIIVFAIFTTLNSVAQNKDPKKTIALINQKFAKVKDYSANVNLKFEIPNVKMSPINAKILYKLPNKFKMRAKGIFFLPKHNPLQTIMKFLQDTSSYQAINSGMENEAGVNCMVINILPSKNMNDLILGKFWIDPTRNLILKSEITTKNNGTVATQNKYGEHAIYGLPSEMKILMDVNKFKIPKMLALDINKKKKEASTTPGKKESASITISFNNYAINKSIPDASFEGE